MTWHEHPKQLVFFTGKGGVGKSSLACATAVKLADEGKRVLLVSTDPASNLAQMFETEFKEHDPTPIEAVPRLDALNIDPELAAEAYRDRIVGPVRNTLPEKVVRRMEEELSGACTTEIAAFDEFTALLTDPNTTERYDHIIFDTAPTGHTLRLLKLPSAWSDFLEHNQSGASCLGPLSGLEKQRQQYQRAVETLADASRTTVILVARPQTATLNEAARTSVELRALGIENQRLVINGLMPEAGTVDDPLAKAMRRRDAEALAHMPAALAAMPSDRVALRAMNIVGIKALRALLTPADAAGISAHGVFKAPTVDAPSLSELVDDIETDGHGLVMVMGKGGVGKTTIASAIAVELASRGHEVLLTTTDPAAHVAEAIGSTVEHLQVSRIDPQTETERYRQHVLSTKGKDLDQQGRSLLEEDLRSPCTEEIAVFQAFSKVIRESRQKFVVMDTAPTGHTLLLLDATGSYHRDIMRHTTAGVNFTTPMMRLQDPEQTKMLIVTLPETTPVLEAASLQDDLRRAGIEPWAWVINASLASAGPSDPLLVARALSEVTQIENVSNDLAKRVALTPWLAQEPVGPQALRALTHRDAATTAQH